MSQSETPTDEIDVSEIPDEKIKTAEGWASLSPAEQQAVLADREQDIHGSGSGSSSDAQASSSSESGSSARPAQSTPEGSARAMFADAMGSWLAEIRIRGTDIALEMNGLSDPQAETVLDRAADLAAVYESEAETAEDLENGLELFESIDELFVWLNGFLADVTADESLDAAYWRGDNPEQGDGNYPAGVRFLLFFEVVEQAQESYGAISGFR